MPEVSSLLSAHDLLLVDLDGVVYLGDEPIPGAADALNRARAQDIRVVYVTNNAARPPEVVAEQLTRMGIQLDTADVMTAAIAAAQRVARDHPAGARVLVVGGAGVRDSLRAAGMEPVNTAEPTPVAVVQGFAPEVGWTMLAEASVAIRAGADWIATNLDATLPSPRGPLPGNGSLVAVLETATGQHPTAIGKPAPALYDAVLATSAGSKPLAIGDRLDTDIAGAVAAELPSLLVFTGVSTPADLLSAAATERPTYIGRDLGALELHHPPLDRSVTSQPATLDGLDGLRQLCAAAWSGSLRPDQYETAVANLNLDLR